MVKTWQSAFIFLFYLYPFEQKKSKGNQSLLDLLIGKMKIWLVSIVFKIIDINSICWTIIFYSYFLETMHVDISNNSLINIIVSTLISLNRFSWFFFWLCLVWKTVQSISSNQIITWYIYYYPTPPLKPQCLY